MKTDPLITVQLVANSLMALVVHANICKLIFLNPTVQKVVLFV